MFRHSVSIADFKAANLQPVIFEKKESRNAVQGQTYTYLEAPFFYKYTNEEHVAVDKLQLVCGKMIFPRGIREGQQPAEQDQRMQRAPPSLQINLNESSEGQALARALEEIHDFAADAMYENTSMLSSIKGSKVPRNKSRESWKDRDGLGDPYIKGENGITKVKYVPLMEYNGTIKTNFKIVYHDEKGNFQMRPISPYLLVGKPLEMIITLYVKRIYASTTLGQYKVQILLSSAIVGNIIENPMSGAELRAARELAESMGAEILKHNKTVGVAAQAEPAATGGSSPKSLQDLPVVDCDEPEWAAAPPPARPEPVVKPEPVSPIRAETPPPAPKPAIRRVLRAAPPPQRVPSESETD